MPWARRLKPPITLNDGRTLVTLKDAADLLLSLPPGHQARPPWLYAAQLLKDAAEGKQGARAVARQFAASRDDGGQTVAQC